MEIEKLEKAARDARIQADASWRRLERWSGAALVTWAAISSIGILGVLGFVAIMLTRVDLR